MISLKNKIMPFFLISVVLSILLHVTVLTAFPLFKNFTFAVPLTRDVIRIDLQDGIKPGFAAVETSRAPLHQKNFEKEEDGEKVISKDEQETDRSNKDEGKAAQGLTDNAAKTSSDQLEKTEETAYRSDYKRETESGQTEIKGGSFQMARSSREKFSYDIYWLGVHVGDASLEMVDINGLLTITSRANSSGFISTFYKVDDYAESVIRGGFPVHFKIRQHEGKYKSDKETIFDTGNKSIAFFNHLKGTKYEHSFADGVAWDVVSGFFYLRTQPLEPGKTRYINIFDSNKFYKAEVNILRREKIEIRGIGEVNTVIVRPELKTEGLFQRKGDVLIWLTDDEKRIPVRIETKVPVGEVVAELRDFLTEK